MTKNRVNIVAHLVRSRAPYRQSDHDGTDVRLAEPIMVVGCTQDHMVPPSHAKALAQMTAGARYAQLPTGHLAPMERPDAFVVLVAAFLREQTTS